MPARPVLRPSITNRTAEGISQGANVVNQAQQQQIGANRVQQQAQQPAPTTASAASVSTGLELHATEQTVSTPQGNVTVEFTPQRVLGGIQYNPSGIKSNVQFTVPFNNTANGITQSGTQTYTYQVSGNQLVPTLVSTQGQVTYTPPSGGNPVVVANITNAGIVPTGNTINVPIYGTLQGKSTFLGTVQYSAAVANGQISLQYSGFQGTNVSEGGSFQAGTNTIGYSISGQTRYNPTTGQITIEFPTFAGGGVLPSITTVSSVSLGNGVSAPVAFQTTFNAGTITSVPIGFSQGGKLSPSFFVTQGAGSPSAVTTQYSLSSAGISATRAYTTVNIAGTPVVETYNVQSGTYSLSTNNVALTSGGVTANLNLAVSSTGAITSNVGSYTFAGGGTHYMLTSSSTAADLAAAGLTSSQAPIGNQIIFANINPTTGFVAYTTISPPQATGATFTASQTAAITGAYLRAGATISAFVSIGVLPKGSSVASISSTVTGASSQVVSFGTTITHAVDSIPILGGFITAAPKLYYSVLSNPPPSSSSKSTQAFYGAQLVTAGLLTSATAYFAITGVGDVAAGTYSLASRVAAGSITRATITTAAIQIGKALPSVAIRTTEQAFLVGAGITGISLAEQAKTPSQFISSLNVNTLFNSSVGISSLTAGVQTFGLVEAFGIGAYALKAPVIVTTPADISVAGFANVGETEIAVRGNLGAEIKPTGTTAAGEGLYNTEQLNVRYLVREDTSVQFGLFGKPQTYSSFAGVNAQIFSFGEGTSIGVTQGSAAKVYSVSPSGELTFTRTTPVESKVIVSQGINEANLPSAIESGTLKIGGASNVGSSRIVQFTGEQLYGLNEPFIFGIGRGETEFTLTEPPARIAQVSGTPAEAYSVSGGTGRLTINLPENLEIIGTGRSGEFTFGQRRVSISEGLAFRQGAEKGTAAGASRFKQYAIDLTPKKAGINLGNAGRTYRAGSQNVPSGLLEAGKLPARATGIAREITGLPTDFGKVGKTEGAGTSITGAGSSNVGVGFGTFQTFRARTATERETTTQGGRLTKTITQPRTTAVQPEVLGVGTASKTGLGFAVGNISKGITGSFARQGNRTITERGTVARNVDILGVGVGEGLGLGRPTVFAQQQATTQTQVRRQPNITTTTTRTTPTPETPRDLFGLPNIGIPRLVNKERPRQRERRTPIKTNYLFKYTPDISAFLTHFKTSKASKRFFGAFGLSRPL